MMKIFIHTKHVAGILALFLGALLLSSCSGGSWFTYTGRETKPENRYELKDGGPHTAEWHSADLALQYTYRIKGNRLYMEGTVVPQNRIKHFNNLRAWISIHILDADGIILDTHRLWSQYGSNTYGAFRWTYRNDWELPPDNRAIGFSFSGVAGSGGENGMQWKFWQTP